MSSNYIILAGGCFWGMEDLFSKFKGVSDTVVGYCGGELKGPSYHDVKKGTTGHAESIKITYEPNETNLEEILHFFFRIHDPTTKDRQGNDIGTQYRSAIFVRNDEQRKTSEKVIREINQSGKWPSEIVTSIEGEREFFLAEDFHQKYLEKNPGGYTCHFIRD